MLRKGTNQNRIKIIVSIKGIITTIPHPTEFNSRTITDTTAMSNISNIKFSPM